MGAKVSAEMLQARELILKGVNPAKAARQCGLTRSAIYHSEWYKKWKVRNDNGTSGYSPKGRNYWEDISKN